MLDKTMLIGNLGADVDLRHTKNNTVVAALRIATTERWKDAQGNQREATEWHRVVVWNNSRTGTGLVDVVEKYLKKGRRVSLAGVSPNHRLGRGGYRREGACGIAGNRMAADLGPRRADRGARRRFRRARGRRRRRPVLTRSGWSIWRKGHYLLFAASGLFAVYQLWNWRLILSANSGG